MVINRRGTMRITEISASVGIKLGLPKFSSANREVSATAKLTPKEDPQKAFKDLLSALRGYLKSEIGDSGYEEIERVLKTTIAPDPNWISDDNYMKGDKKWKEVKGK